MKRYRKRPRNRIDRFRLSFRQRYNSLEWLWLMILRILQMAGFACCMWFVFCTWRYTDTVFEQNVMYATRYNMMYSTVFVHREACDRYMRDTVWLMVKDAR